ncbi:MAG TPA: NYN domain-containing protein [Polyangiaceae bacterium]|nr:NYN domain-containing protein [Polyangiaceae bacterium]
MDRAAVFVDAGYVFAEGSKLVAGQKLTRSQLLLEYDVLLQLLHDITVALTGLPLLRVYWYDGASAGPTPSHVALSHRPNVKLRLGGVDATGQQGVDDLIAHDLTTLSQNRVMADALLLTGDDDVRPAAELAQEHGVRLHLLAIPPARDNQAAALMQTADTCRELTEAEVRSFLRKRVPVAP